MFWRASLTYRNAQIFGCNFVAVRDYRTIISVLAMMRGLCSCFIGGFYFPPSN